ncbi:MAG: arsenate reductase ArsC [Acidobacteriota bacterium]|nr:arsenate reductase ArsC [Acidobacteriota bacterium]
MLPKLKVLFLCTGNSCRSQMVEEWARHLPGDVVGAYLAGHRPGRVDARAVEVMREAGVDISGQRSKHVNGVSDSDFHWVVTVCSDADRNCLVFPGKARRIHAPFDDPPRLTAHVRTTEQALVVYRRVRAEIGAFVRDLPSRIDLPRHFGDSWGSAADAGEHG